MKCISDLMLDDYAWWCSWSSFNCFLTSEMSHRPVLGDLPAHLTLRSSSNHVICIIINYSLHGYIRTSLLHLGTFFNFFVSLLSLRLAKVCVYYPEYTMFTPVINLGSLLKHVILLISILESLHHAFIWKNINNDIMNTSGWNATMIDPCACGYFL